MAEKSKNHFYVILALVLCALLVLPYLGVLDSLVTNQDLPSVAGAARPLRREAELPLDQPATKESVKSKQDEQKKRLAEIEQLLD